MKIFAAFFVLGALLQQVVIRIASPEIEPLRDFSVRITYDPVINENLSGPSRDEESSEVNPLNELGLSASTEGHEVTRLSNRIKAKIKVLCWIPSRTNASVLIERIWSTWKSSCDEFVFTSTEANEERNVVKISLDTSKSLWNIVHPAWNYIEEKYVEQFDWFVKLDDDTFFCAENFKHLVKDKDPEQYFYLGHVAFENARSVDDPRAPFNLGAGHALSRGTLRKLAPFLPESKKPLPPGATERCPRWVSWAEDVMLGNCLWIAGVGGPNNTRDEWMRENFLSFLPPDNFITVRRPDSKSWFWRGKPQGTGSGAKCCSSRPILWHNLKLGSGGCSGCVYYLDYFLYNLMVDPVRP